MKKILAMHVLLFLGFFLQAQKPEKVYSIVKQIHSSEWYLEQASLWKAELDKDSTNADAWLNYYTANRMYKLTTNNKEWTNNKENVLSELNDIIKKCERTIPNSFEYNYIKWYNGGNNPENFPFLKKAYEIAPDRVETYDDFIVYYLLHHNNEKMKEFCEKWFNSNDLSQGLLAFGYNMLMSVDKNAIIFTNGDNDTYPLWILQHVKDIRSDVTVLNIHLLMVESYRKELLKRMKLPKLEIDYKSLKSTEELRHKIVKHFIDYYTQDVYFATTVNKSIYDSFKSDIYLEGLAFKYSLSSYDNIAIMKRNYEKYFLTDYIKTELSIDMSKSVIDLVNSNYLLPFMSLYEHYQACEDLLHQNEIRNLILIIAERSGHLDEVKKDLE